MPDPKTLEDVAAINEKGNDRSFTRESLLTYVAGLRDPALGRLLHRALIAQDAFDQELLRHLKLRGPVTNSIPAGSKP